MVEEIISVGDWVANYESVSSQRVHRSNMKKFLESAYPDIAPKEVGERLDELSKRYVEEVRAESRTTTKDVTAYNKQIIKDNISPNTRSMRFSSLSTFCKMNELKLNSEIWRIAKTTGKKKVVKTVSEEHIPTHEELTQILSHLSFHNKTVALMLISSGMRPAEPFALRLDQLEREEDKKIISRLNDRPMRIDLEAEQTKTAQDRYVFISDEARGALIEWIKYRPQFVKSIENKAKGLGKATDLSDRVFPFTLSNFRTNWNNALKKAGLYKLSRKTKKARVTIPPKILRKFFRTKANWSNPEVAEFLMGHIGADINGNRNGNGELKKIYAKYKDAPEIIQQVYIEAEPNLTIMGNIPELFDLRGQVDELNEVAQSKGDEILEKSSLVKYMRRDIDHLTNEVKELRQIVTGLNAYIDMLKENVAINPEKIYEPV